MRVLRTELYFDESEVNGFEGFSSRREPFDKNPGVGFAWFRSDEPLENKQISNLKQFRSLRKEDRGWPERDDIEAILDLFVRDADESSFFRLPSPTLIENRTVTQYILDQEIVMENSPPFSLSLRAVLTKANTPLWIGTFMGFSAGWGHPVLLFLTVPGGIIVVSSAHGIGRAMDAGLNKAIERLFKNRR